MPATTIEAPSRVGGLIGTLRLTFKSSTDLDREAQTLAEISAISQASLLAMSGGVSFAHRWLEGHSTDPKPTDPKQLDIFDALMVVKASYWGEGRITSAIPGPEISVVGAVRRQVSPATAAAAQSVGHLYRVIADVPVADGDFESNVGDRDLDTIVVSRPSAEYRLERMTLESPLELVIALAVTGLPALGAFTLFVKSLRSANSQVRGLQIDHHQFSNAVTELKIEHAELERRLRVAEGALRETPGAQNALESGALPIVDATVELKQTDDPR